MDVNGPYLNDLELGVNTVPILQYNFSGFFTGIVYYLLTRVFELVPPHKLRVTIEECWRSTKKILPRSSGSYAEPLLESSSKNTVLDLDKDVDVQKERNRVLSGSTDNSIIYLCNLRKFKKKNVLAFYEQMEQRKLQPFQCYLLWNSSNSHAQAQALCTRIGIMVGDRLRCIGSPQHLKTRFGNHLELELPYGEDLLLADVFGHLE